MRRFFIDPSDIQQSEGFITGDEAHHMVHVLRLNPGDEIELYDGTGKIYGANVTSTDRKKVGVTISNTRQVKEQPPFLHLGMALLTGKKMDLVLQKATELGVKSLQPFTSRFSTSKNIGRNKKLRWQKISVEACKQCGRSLPPEIRSLNTFDDICESTGFNLKVIFYEDERQLGLETIENQIHDCLPQSVLVLIGPEGGFSAEEIKKADQHGFIAVGLGPLILRAETAAVTGVSLLQYLLGNLKPDIS